MAHAPTPPNYNPSHQIGVAAIEFALIVTLLCLMLVGCLIYWRVLQAQQSVTRSAGDGARLARSGPCQNENRSIDGQHGVTLFGVQTLEIVGTAHAREVADAGGGEGVVERFRH